MLRLLYSALVIFFVSVTSSSLYAQSSDTEQAAAPAGQSAAEREKTLRDTSRFQWKEHPTLQLWTGGQVEFRLRLQGDLRDSDATIGDSRLGDTARRRIGITGELTERLDFQVERELTGDDPWRDVYANYRLFDSLQAQAGKFKLPFSLDENTSATNLDFVYRSMAAEALAPGRDRGVMVHGRGRHRTIRYEFGAFEHEGRNARTDNPHRTFGGRTLAGRVTGQPFRGGKTPLRTMEASVAMTRSGLGEGLSSLRGDTVLGGRFYTADAFVNGTRERVGVEFRWEPGPVSIKSEYMRLADERRGESVEDTDLSPLVATGWYVSGVWKVMKPVKSWHGGWHGGVELAARVEALTFGSAALNSIASASPRADVVVGNRDTALTLGLNWSPNRWIRIQANLIREVIANPNQGPSRSGPFWSRAMRFQLVL